MIQRVIKNHLLVQWQIDVLVELFSLHLWEGKSHKDSKSMWNPFSYNTVIRTVSFGWPYEAGKNAMLIMITNYDKMAYLCWGVVLCAHIRCNVHMYLVCCKVPALLQTGTRISLWVAWFLIVAQGDHTVKWNKKWFLEGSAQEWHQGEEFSEGFLHLVVDLLRWRGELGEVDERPRKSFLFSLTDCDHKVRLTWRNGCNVW